MQLVVTEKGRAGDIQVISPLGYGLDENAVAAIQKWEFMPARKDGAAVPVRATIEVNFPLSWGWHSTKAMSIGEHNSMWR